MGKHETISYIASPSDESFEAARFALGALCGISKTVPEERVAETANMAMTVLRSLPREHLIEISKIAVVQRNNDALDHMGETAIKNAIFTEQVMLSILSDEEKVQVLGNK